MSDSDLAAYLAQNPRMTGVLFAALVLVASGTGGVAATMANAGP